MQVLDFGLAPLSLNDIGLIVLGIFTLYLAAGIGWQFIRRQRRRTRREFGQIERLREIAVEKEESRINKLSRAYGIYVNRPKSYYYLDKESIDSLFNQISPLFRPVEIEEEDAKETQKGVHGGFPVFGLSFGRKSGHTQSVTKRPVETVEYRYDTIVRYLVENAQVILGLEQFDYDNRGERSFLELCEAVANYGIAITQEQRGTVIGTERRRFGESKLKELSEAKGYALISGSFIVAHDSTSGSVLTLSYRHPISEFVGADIRINASCAQHLTNSGKEVFQQVPDIRVAMLAEIVRMSGNILNVKPLAIHSI